MYVQICYIDTVYDLYMSCSRKKGEVALVGGFTDPCEERVRWNLSELKEIKSLVCEQIVITEDILLNWLRSCQPSYCET